MAEKEIKITFAGEKLEALTFWQSREEKPWRSC